MQLHELKRKTSNKKSVRVGRGGRRGKTSGRGMKGQKQHGGTPRPEIRDMIKKLPKKRGHGKNRARTVIAGINVKPLALNLDILEKTFKAGDTVSPGTLLAKSLISKQAKRVRGVKILGYGSLSKKIIVTNCKASTKAKEAILKAGGSVSS